MRRLSAVLAADLPDAGNGSFHGIGFCPNSGRLPGPLPGLELRTGIDPERTFAAPQGTTRQRKLFDDSNSQGRHGGGGLALAPDDADEWLVRWGPARRLGRIVLVVAAIAFLVAPRAVSQPAVPQGVWLMDKRVAVQIFECDGLMCGRIIWLRVPRDPQGLLNRDKNNPDPALRERKLCGLTILWGLRPLGANRWRDGWFYNPDDGKSYSVEAQLKSDDFIVARIYVGAPIFGKTKTLARVPHDTSDGWC